MKGKIFNSLFWKISAVMLTLLVLFLLVNLYIFYSSANTYVDEVNQNLGRDIASFTVREISPFVDGDVNEEAIQDIMHSMMVINPSVEVYLLDPAGEIITYVAPYKEVKLERVDLTPVKAFIESESNSTIKGDNPRTPGLQSIFSAAPIIEEDQLLGYIYIILASQEYAGVRETYMSSITLMIVRNTSLMAIAFTLIIGLIAVWFLTKNINTIAESVRKFRDGDLSARIDLKGQGEFTEFATTFNDMAIQIERNVNELQSVESMRRELIANVSHDLRSPISSILGYIETVLMQSDTISKEQLEEYLQIALRNGHKLESLIQDMFQLAKLEAKQLALVKEPTNVSELILDVVNTYKVPSKDKGVTINTVVSQELPMANVDVSLIDRVLQNIMDNSLKFCDKGDAISIETEYHDEQIVVKISDTGAGISDADIPHVFDRYYQSNTAGTTSGTGLGLAIVKKILELHQSTVTLVSRLNKGTTISFTLPIN